MAITMKHLFLALSLVASPALAEQTPIPDRYQTGYCWERYKQIDADGRPSQVINTVDRSWIFHFSDRQLRTAWRGLENFDSVIRIRDGGVVLSGSREVTFTDGELFSDEKIHYTHPFSAQVTEVYSMMTVTRTMRCQGVPKPE